MLMRVQKLKKSKKGFTLIELIVVIAILGILAAIAVPRLSAYRADATLAADNATCAIVGKAAEAFSATQTTQPTTIGATDVETYLDAATNTKLTNGDYTINVDETTFEVSVTGPGTSAYPKP